MAIDFPATPAIDDTHEVGNVTWTWDGIAWTIISTSGGGGGGGGGITTVAADTGSVANEASLTIAGGTDIETSATGTTVTINYTGTGGGGGGGGASSLNDLSDVNVSSIQENEVLKYVGGEWTNATDATGDGGGGGGASTFAGLTDVPDGLDVSQIYEPAITMFRVDNNGTSAYTFSPHYSGDNPTLFVLSGTTIAFDLSEIAGHPFEIQDSTGQAYNTGLVHVGSDGTVSTGSNAQGKTDGTLYWRIPETTISPPNYRYQCTIHSAMVGPITIKDFSQL